MVPYLAFFFFDQKTLAARAEQQKTDSLKKEVKSFFVRKNKDPIPVLDSYPAVATE
jgi:hypothetical protein